MTRMLVTTLFFALFAALGCGSGIEYRHAQNDEEGQFDRYRTMSFLDSSDIGTFSRAELTEDQREFLRDVALPVFAEKGWTIVDDDQDADLIMLAGVGRRIRVEERVEGVPSMRFDTYEEEINEGTIVLDAWDRRTETHVWHGQVIGTTRDTPDPDRATEAVRLLLSEFPAAGQGEPLPADTSGGEDMAPADDGADDAAEAGPALEGAEEEEAAQP
ncbi:MAG: DUF4136 domain-containing protein [Deltaproteobacteria bacterium]|nr:DUF4136 domain-containing protein [Deltaproteobacteria bacterium]